jgi:hypothetical protein
VAQDDLGRVLGRQDARRRNGRRLGRHARLLDEADTPAERVERLVRAVFAIYERGAPELWVIRTEPGAHPSVAEAGEEIEATLSALVDAAAITPADRPVVRAMIDLATWQALRDHGLGPAEAVDAVSEMLAARAGNG